MCRISRAYGKSSATSMTRLNSSIASMRRTRSTAQMESGVPLSRMALRSRLVGACNETSCRWCASSAPAIARISDFIEYSKWLRVQKISRAWNLASEICPKSSGVNFRDTNKYVESSLFMIPSKESPYVSIPRRRLHRADRRRRDARRFAGRFLWHSRDPCAAASWLRGRDSGFHTSPARHHGHGHAALFPCSQEIRLPFECDSGTTDDETAAR